MYAQDGWWACRPHPPVLASTLPAPHHPPSPHAHYRRVQKCAQVLLTLDNLANRSQYINAKNTFEELLR